MVLARQRDGEGSKGGDHTGPSPTDRAKLGTKRHVLTDARGVPLAVEVTGANIHDKWMAGATLDAIVFRGRRGPLMPKHLCLDKGYDYADTEQEVWDRGVTPHIRRRGEPPLIGRARGKPRRWVVERTNSWHNRFRALLVRYERKAANYLALVHLACGLIALQQAHRC
jgi:putative transposase